MYVPEDKQDRRVGLCFVELWELRFSENWGSGRVGFLEKARKTMVLEIAMAVARTRPWELSTEDMAGARILRKGATGLERGVKGF